MKIYISFHQQQYVVLKHCKKILESIMLVYFPAGVQCCIELRTFADAIQWCDEGLKAHPTDKKLLELRAAADKHKVQSPKTAAVFMVEVLVSLFHLSTVNAFYPREQQREMPERPKPKKKSCMGRKKLFWLL